MGAPFKVGADVRQIVKPPLTGKVKAVTFDDKRDAFCVLVDSGETERWFWQEEIEAMPAATEGGAA